MIPFIMRAEPYVARWVRFHKARSWQDNRNWSLFMVKGEIPAWWAGVSFSWSMSKSFSDVPTRTV